MTNKLIAYLFFAIVILIVTIKIYYLLDFPPLADEVYSYLYFIHPGPLASVTDYREPNNHIFYSLISSIITALPFDGIIIMRCISFSSYLFLLYYLYHFTQKEFGHLSAFLALGFHGFLLATGTFAILGRGYMFMALFGSLAIIHGYQYFNKEASPKHLLLFTLFNVSGLFTIPSYLFVLSGLYAYSTYQLLWVKKNKKTFTNFSYSVVATVILAILLYTPVVLSSGSDALFHNQWVISMEFSALIDILPTCILETCSALTGIESKVYIILLLWLIAVLVLAVNNWQKQGFNQWFLLFLFLFITPIILILIQHRYPPYRTFYYLSFILFTSFAITLATYIERLNNTLLKKIITVVVLLFTTTVGVYQFQQASQHDLVYGIPRSYYDSVKSQCILIFSTQPRSIYIDTKDEYLDLYLRYEQQKRDAVSITHKAGNNADILVLYKQYFPSSINPDQYQFIRQTSEVRIYRKLI